MVEVIEKSVFELVEDYNAQSLFTFKRHPLNHQTELNGDFRMDPNDAYELLEKFAEKFSIKPNEIDFSRYFPESREEPKHILTIQMLIDSARAGRWVDNN
ncbi:uncharacterized protein DUF1493 [Pantoea sp. PNA 14-12]|uniref:DUF1493 family protein n=1 Tax=Pantoea TaxID=53335 RepID=UPI00105E0BEF|nr:MULTISPECIES: DUF1493 family protein [Pantoea]TDS68383.1 uncharacterized protein DUF1493 [Pantoea sp. PNA 14-12]